jgi:hypothetical protein
MTYLIDAKTPKGQAGQMLRAINREAESMGQNASAVMEKQPMGNWDSKKVNHYRVAWEEGPYEWAILCASGEDIWHEELRMPSVEPTFEFADHVYFEVNRSFELCFHPWKSFTSYRHY